MPAKNSWVIGEMTNMTHTSYTDETHHSKQPTPFPYPFMKIQLASDLHLEFLASYFPAEARIKPSPEADVLVLAGDIHTGTRVLNHFKDWPVPVLYVAGNHEFYSHTWKLVRQDLRRQCAGTSVHFLDNSRIDIDDVRFLGCTLWTDFKLSPLPPLDAMQHVEQRLYDFRKIYTDQRLLTGQDTLDDHLISRAWLTQELATPFAGKTVVISHHAPHPNSIHLRYQGDPLNAGFASDLSELVVQADLWLHGHVHDSFDYRLGASRVVANPGGYFQNVRELADVSDAVLENPLFNPSLVIDLETETTKVLL